MLTKMMTMMMNDHLVSGKKISKNWKQRIEQPMQLLSFVVNAIFIQVAVCVMVVETFTTPSQNLLFAYHKCAALFLMISLKIVKLFYEFFCLNKLNTITDCEISFCLSQCFSAF